MVKPAVVSRSTTGRVRWHPRRLASAPARGVVASGGPARRARPCSTKCSVPPGLRTRRSSCRAAATSGMVHSVPGGQGGVVAVVREGQRLAVQAGPLHRDAGRAQALAGQSPADLGGLDRGDPGDGRRVEGDVEPRPEADLDDVPGQTVAHPAPQRCDGLGAARDVDDPREDSLPIEPHDLLLCRQDVGSPAEYRGSGGRPS